MQKKKKRNKSEQKDKQVSKKEAYKSRAKVTSKDLKSFNFSRVMLTENQANITEILQNRDSHDKTTRFKSSQKRSHGRMIGKDSEVKKRRQNTSQADIICNFYKYKKR